MSARETIAYCIPGSSAEHCFGHADNILEALATAGYRILSNEGEGEPVAWIGPRDLKRLGAGKAASVSPSRHSKDDKPLFRSAG